MRPVNPLRKNSVKALALSLFVLAAGVTAQAQDAVYDNLTTTTNYGTTTGVTVGMAFTTGLTPLSLTDVVFPQLAAATNTSAVNTAETFSINLRNSDGTIGAAVPVLPGTFQVFDNGGGQADASVNTAFVLLPSTSYYFSITAPTTVPATTVIWNDATGNSAAPKVADGVVLPTGHLAYSTDAAGAITYYDTNFQIAQVLANPVPEPTTYCLMAVAGLALVVSRKRSHKVA